MDFGQLKTAVAAWANRSDLTSMMATFYELAEQRVYNGSPDFGVDQLRISPMLVTVNPFTGTLPSDVCQIQRLAVIMDSSRRKSLEFIPYGQISTSQDYSGTPAFYSLNGSTVVYGPTFTNDVELTYYAKFASPSVDADTNWLLTNASSVLLYGMLVEVALYLRDQELLATVGKLYANAVNAVIDNDQQYQHSGSTLRIVTDNPMRR